MRHPSQPRPDSPWSGCQVRVVHIYAHLAGMDDPEYRAWLQAHTLLGRYHHGAITSKDQRLTQLDFDQFMPALEAEVWRRVDAGLVEKPGGKYSARCYWATRCGQFGAITSRQRWWIGKHWPILAAQHGYEASYLDAMVFRATNGACRAWGLASAAQADLLITAILDRLNHAPAAAPSQEVPTT